MSWTVYRIERADTSFYWMRTFAELCEIAAEEGELFAQEVFEAEIEGAFEAAREAGWDGSLNEEPHVFILPAKVEFKFGFVWTSLDEERPMFVVAPEALPWLEA
ncbi:hypothetical protein AB4Y43_16715 [Paraburkholderia sp. BR10872]|uniref:hypothetical protein n=1 Tax=Paraburkholderia sp. BR10872 TaxID=3236989 RepID=UPI0034D24594